MKKIFVLSLLFLLSPSFAVVTDFTNLCGNTASNTLLASFTPIQYTCDANEYLPANALGCSACPNGATCAGGTYAFNAIAPQGVTYNAPFTQNQNDLCSHSYIYARADFSPIQYTCSSGYYLPANGIECAPCPTGGNCSGGTYTFNETTNQGVDSCDSGYYEDNGTCVANTITVRWDDGNGGAYTTTCTYGGTLTTPTTPPVAPKGYHFTGWTFNLGND